MALKPAMRGANALYESARHDEDAIVAETMPHNCGAVLFRASYAFAAYTRR